ncbi:MAG: hypothetical protein ACLUBL_02965 [Fusobacterium sp.]|uniref:hypothetical protein n=1 Tax=Fusobacterium sp. TaxID=68766 RepID=UPI0039955979
MEFKKTVTQFKEAIQYDGTNAEELKKFILDNLEEDGNEAHYDEKEYNIKFKRDGKDMEVQVKGILFRIYISKKSKYEIKQLITSDYLVAGKNAFNVVTAEKFEKDWEATEEENEEVA